jgi:hypothetical protein
MAGNHPVSPEGCCALHLQHLVKVADLASELARAVGGATALDPLLRALLPTLARARPAVSTHAPAGAHTCAQCVHCLLTGKLAWCSHLGA